MQSSVPVLSLRVVTVASSAVSASPAKRPASLVLSAGAVAVHRSHSTGRRSDVPKDKHQQLDTANGSY